MHACRDQSDANRARADRGRGGFATGKCRRGRDRPDPAALVPRPRPAYPVRGNDPHHVRFRPDRLRAERAHPSGRRGERARPGRQRQRLGHHARSARHSARWLRDRRGRAARERRDRRGDEGHRDQRARVRRLDARFRGRRIQRRCAREHGRDRGRAEGPDDDHVEPAGVDDHAGRGSARRRDAGLDEVSRDQRRRALPASAHVDRLRARCRTRAADSSELGRPQ